MSFELLPNLVLILAVVGMLGLLLRRVPDVVESKAGLSEVGSQEISAPIAGAALLQAADQNKSLWAIVGTALAAGLLSTLKFLQNVFVGIFSRLIKTAWKFMLEAKDLPKDLPHSRQSLAARVSKIITVKSHGAAAKVEPAKTENQPMPSDGQPINISEALQKAEQLVNNRDFEPAEQIYMSILKKHPHEYPAYEGLAQLYLSKKHYAEAQETLEFLIRHNAEDDSYLAQLGNVLVKRRKLAQAAEAYEKSLDLNPQVAARQFNLGSCYLALGQHEKARVHLQKAVDEEPQNMQYLERLNALTRVVTEVDKRS